MKMIIHRRNSHLSQHSTFNSATVIHLKMFLSLQHRAAELTTQWMVTDKKLINQFWKSPINHSSRFTSWVKAAGLSSSESSWGRRAVVHCSSKTNAHSTDYRRWPANSNDNDSTTSIYLPSINITSTPSICFAGTVSSASKLDNFRLDRGKKSWKWKEICAWMINRQQQPFHQCKIIKLLMSALEYQFIKFFTTILIFKIIFDLKKIWISW